MKRLNLQDISRQFEIDDKKAREFVSMFHSEMSLGLKKEKSSLKMLSSFVKMPTGRERGRFLALDLGGTNFRVMAVELSGDRSFKLLASGKHSISNGLMTGKGAALFDFIASKLDQYLTDNRFSRHERYGLGFTFSFPVEQTAINAGRLIHWTKGFKAEGVEGKDVVVLLEEALKRREIDCISVKALANDTVGTLMTKSYGVPECRVGVILGTGTNACYPEERTMNGTIVNIEWGNFDKFEGTLFDGILDDASHNRGAQLFEKAVSGMYLGEIYRLVMTHIGEKVSNAPYSMSSEDLSNIASAPGDSVAKDVARIVSTRSARLASLAIASILLWEGGDGGPARVVAIDGSLYEKYPGYKEMLRSFLKDMNVRFELAKDGSGIGAAIIAAVASMRRTLGERKPTFESL